MAVAQSKDKKDRDPFENVDVDILREGTKMVLPNEPQPMNYDSAINVLKRKKEEEESTISIYEKIDCFPWDGAIAFMSAMRHTYGWTQAVPTGFWQIPPTYMSVQTGHRPEDKVQVIWGSFEIPGIEGVLQTAMDEIDGRTCFCINGHVKQKYHRDIANLVDLTKKFVKQASIYKGKAFRLFFNSDGQIDPNRQPQFLNLTTVNPEELIFSQLTQDQVNTNILAPIQNTEVCRKHKIPLRRGILLEGPYGVGKTLLSANIARICEENNWTFIMIDKAKALDTALEFARLYSPCVVFAEDIDKALSGNRSAEMDAILNTVDGVQSKTGEVMLILTTNEVEKIHQAMLRPGRLDAVISITAPDAAAAERLMRVYARGLIASTEKLTEAGKSLAGQIPATIREVVERSKLAAIFRARGESFMLTDHDLYTASEGMKNHLSLLNKPKDNQPSLEEKLGTAVRDVIVANAKDPVLNNRIKSFIDDCRAKFGLRAG
jgi:hypothetical protein